MHVLIAPDKFKGSLTATQAAAALAEGWRQGWPVNKPLEIECLPVADGGEGTAEAIHDALIGRWITLAVHDPIGRIVEGRYALVEDSGDERLAVLEMSSASGFSLVRGNDRDLLRGNTFGTGQLLAHALREGGADRVAVGIGGSATNDGGIGLAAALGFRFLDADRRELEPTPLHLPELASIEFPHDALPSVPINVACDVKNPLLGPRGATRVYGPQKGLRDEAQAAQLELGLARLADVAAQTFGQDLCDTPGAGAAGGLGFGLMTFCGAELLPGFGLVASRLGWRLPSRARTWCSPERAVWTGKHRKVKLQPASPPWPDDSVDRSSLSADAWRRPPVLVYVSVLTKSLHSPTWNRS
jgi:glycerate 2-kinase